jgi:APA family basic amino acid/polyamine antiporter
MSVSFSRKATGLVRQASARDVFVYNVNFINIAIGVAFMFLLMPAGAYPGVNMALSTVLCSLCVLPCSLVYAMFASALPRSGGDYVYVSRSLSPVWGFVANWNYTIWCFFYIGVPAAFLGRYGISSLMRILGAYFASPGLTGAGAWFVSPLGVFITGAALILIFAGLFVVGINAYMRVQNLLFLIATAGLVAMLFALFGFHGSFAAAFNTYMARATGQANTYGAVMGALGKNAVSAAPFSMSSTLTAMTWPFTVLGFSIASAYIGGEIKGANRSQLLGMPGSLVYSALWILVLVAGVLHVAGFSFMGDLGAVDPTKVHLAFTPTVAEIAAMAPHNLLLVLLIGIGFLLWTYTWLPIYLLTTTRCLLAWALDGLAAGRLADVDERTHSPIWAILVSAVIGIVFLYIYAYSPSFATISGFFGQVFTFLLTSVAAIVFPWRQRELFRSSPVAWRIGRLPVVSLLGGLSVIGLLLIEWAFLHDPNSGISLQAPTMLLINLAVFAAGFVYYAGARWWRARQGIDIRLAFAEIPPE